jgi:hypothetical protein
VRTLPHVTGIVVGFPLMVIAVGLGLGEIFTRYPQVHLVLKYLGAAYLLYLAWRIAQAGRPDGGSADARPLTFLEAAAFQWLDFFNVGVEILDGRNLDRSHRARAIQQKNRDVLGDIHHGQAPFSIGETCRWGLNREREGMAAQNCATMGGGPNTHPAGFAPPEPSAK